MKGHYFLPKRLKGLELEFYVTCNECGATTSREMHADISENLKIAQSKNAQPGRVYTVRTVDVTHPKAKKPTNNFEKDILKDSRH